MEITKVLKIVGMVTSVVGTVATFASGIANNQLNKITTAQTISEEVAKQLAEAKENA